MEKTLKYKKNKVIEVEFRGLLTKIQHSSLMRRLNKEKIKFEDDNKDTFFLTCQAAFLSYAMSNQKIAAR